MNILHINYSDHRSGAYLAMWGLHESLQRQGIHSKVLLLNQANGSRPEQYVYWNFIAEQGFEKMQQWLRNRRTHRQQQAIRHDAHNRGLLFSFPQTPYRIHKHPLFAWADIIHLHNVSGFLDWQSFFGVCTKKVVWTVHDCEPFDDGFHTRYGVPSELYAEVRRNNMIVKKKALLSKKTGIEWVFPSHYHMKRAISGQFPVSPASVIFHPVDASVFYPEHKKNARQVLGLDTQQRYLLFAASELNRKEKGFRLLLGQLPLLRETGYRLLALGGSPPGEIPADVILCGSVNNAAHMRLYYSVADLLLSPSYEESFGLSIAESVFCGTPVISRPVGIAPELGTEYVHMAADESDEAYTKKLAEVLKDPPLQPATAFPAETFGSATLVNRYLELYLRS